MPHHLMMNELEIAQCGCSDRLSDAVVAKSTYRRPDLVELLVLGRLPDRPALSIISTAFNKLLSHRP